MVKWGNEITEENLSIKITELGLILHMQGNISAEDGCDEIGVVES
jgi:hypothetical protein